MNLRRPSARRHRRASGGGGAIASPLGLPDLHSWWHADLGLTLDPTYVSTWADQSGNANDLTQAVAGNRPIPSTLTVSGKAAIFFDESRQDYMGNAAVSSVGSTTPACTFFVCAEVGAVDEWRDIYSWQAAMQWGLRTLGGGFGKTAAMHVFSLLPESVAEDTAPGTLVRYIGTYSGGASGTATIMRNLTDTASASGAIGGTISATPAIKVGGFNGIINTSGMRIRTIGAYTRALSSVEQALLDAYLVRQL